MKRVRCFVGVIVACLVTGGLVQNLNAKVIDQMKRDVAVVSAELSKVQPRSGSTVSEAESVNPLAKRSDDLGPVRQFSLVDCTSFPSKPTSFIRIRSLRGDQEFTEEIQVTGGRVVSIVDAKP